MKILVNKLRRLKRRLKRKRSLIGRLLRQHIYARNLTRPIRKTVMYEAFHGSGMLCHPYALFDHLHGTGRYLQDHSHVWAITDPAARAIYRKKYADDRRVKIIKRNGFLYYANLARAKYLINNSTWPTEFVKRDEQIYLNTWHGSPIKKMGFDRVDGKPEANNILRNFLHSDYLLSNSPYMTDRMYRSGYPLEEIFEGKILETGSPRSDVHNMSSSSKIALKERLMAVGIDIPPDAKIILYAPTWKGRDFFNPIDESTELIAFVSRMNDVLQKSDNVRILLKSHQSVYDTLKTQNDARKWLIPNEFLANEILAIADALITDYSSIALDYLSLKKPVFFFLPTEKDYAQYLGTYLKPEELPGIVAQNESELLSEISNILHERESRVNHDEFALNFAPYDDGFATERVCKMVFGDTVPDIGQVHSFGGLKKKVLIYGGGMIANGITESLLNLLNNLDYNKFDVTLLTGSLRRRDQRSAVERLPAEVRLLSLVGSHKQFYPGTLFRRFALRKKSFTPGRRIQLTAAEKRLLDFEWKRVFGSSNFDFAIDFSGYSTYWALLLSRAKNAKKLIWLHNDLWAEWSAYLAGKRPGGSYLYSVFSLYEKYDLQVSVSESLNEVNRRNLKQFAKKSHFVSVKNTLNLQRISSEGANGQSLLPLSEMEMISLRSMVEKHGLAVIRDELSIADVAQRAGLYDDGIFTFISMGRMSPEKNHERLIRAFHLLSERFPNSRLLILGDGPLRHDLEQLVLELSLVGRVIFAGQVNNPFRLMAIANCFVLSSDHEGQPMVLLEALTLQLPIVSTDFSSVRGVLPEGTGIITERTVESLAEGMNIAITGHQMEYSFDAQQYNVAAIDDFINMLE